MKNITVIIAAIFAIISVALAVFLRPVRNTGFELTGIYPTTTEKVFTYTVPESEKTTEIETETTTRENVPTTSRKAVTSSSVPSTTKYQSKLVSRLHEAVEKDREWLSKHEKTTTKAYSMSPAKFRRAGVIYYNGYRFTYYSEKVLPGKGLNIPGRHSDGDFVRDGDGYICVASSDLKKGTVVQTPFGPGKVYDSGCPSGTIDIYVSW